MGLFGFLSKKCAACGIDLRQSGETHLEQMSRAMAQQCPQCKRMYCANCAIRLGSSLYGGGACPYCSSKRTG